MSKPGKNAPVRDFDVVDSFAFRNGEKFRARDGDLAGCRYAMMFATVRPLPFEQAARSDGLSVEPCVVCAAERDADGWRWLHLSAQAKEILVRLYLDSLPRDVWHGIEFEEMDRP